MQVPAADMEAWQQIPVYFGTNVASVCRGMTQSQVSAFFSRGRLCVRAYQPISGTCISFAIQVSFLLMLHTAGAKGD